jgi:hypothetical protein
MRVNILGCAPGWQEAPLDDGERWGINDNHKVIDKIDLIFDCHNLKRVMKGKEKLGRRSIEEVREHLKLVKKKGIPMFCTTEFKNIPNIKRYPIEDIIKRWGSDYFGSGCDYAIAYALYKGFTEIHLYGILMTVTEDEYYHQKPSVEHWGGVAIGSGAKFLVHDSTRKRRCSIFRTRTGGLYGFNIKQETPLHVLHDLQR